MLKLLAVFAEYMFSYTSICNIFRIHGISFHFAEYVLVDLKAMLKMVD